MADPKTKRLKPSALKENIESNDAIDGFEDYDPSNKDFTKKKINASRANMVERQAKETQSYGIYLADRDVSVAAEHEHNDMIRGERTQVKAQYGENSDQVQAVGLKKKSEYKSKTRKPKPPTT